MERINQYTHPNLSKNARKRLRQTQRIQNQRLAQIDYQLQHIDNDTGFPVIHTYPVKPLPVRDSETIIQPVPNPIQNQTPLVPNQIQNQVPLFQNLIQYQVPLDQIPLIQDTISYHHQSPMIQNPVQNAMDNFSQNMVSDQRSLITDQVPLIPTQNYAPAVPNPIQNQVALVPQQIQIQTPVIPNPVSNQNPESESQTVPNLASTATQTDGALKPTVDKEVQTDEESPKYKDNESDVNNNTENHNQKFKLKTKTYDSETDSYESTSEEEAVSDKETRTKMSQSVLRWLMRRNRKQFTVAREMKIRRHIMDG